MTKQRNKILRKYRFMTPGRFHAFNQRVSKALANNTKIPKSIWVANPKLLENYFSTSARHDAVYHEALFGSRLVISKREILQEQIILYLDEIALVLEAAELHYPDILLSSGFDIIKDRRSSSRRGVITFPEAAAEGQGEDQGEPT